ncbi:GNAT family N-acetyltransferase [Plesiomonas shigelloides]|uniref:GNAT family N-acetyltransferase n=1 Tax=Plesiomonas shigelloides TaxID=703 RepID=UPI001261B404|nr:GNAT family N-acetyltransferase [Plesiomonas shigelloides]KAB7702623.1 GNAT family N-acetyltransferase [Plesiomonas shigelloides]MDT1009885.1 GNAT family N-acetyltransferase [Plesiomonas shigelloides]
MQEIHISDQRKDVDDELVYQFLSGQSGWARRIPRETLLRGLDHSLCFTALKGDEQVGFCRVISDFATFAYLCDVFVVESCRGQGIAGSMLEAVMEHPDLQGLRRFVLTTSDAHALYNKYGFEPLARPQSFMEIHDPNIYKRADDE